MCNLSQGIKERARKEALAEGRAERDTTLITNMYQRGFSVDQIAEIVEKSLAEVEETILKVKRS